MARTFNPEITDAQMETLVFIYEFLKRHCYQPNLTEMALHFRVTKMAIRSRLEGLAARGAVSLPPGYGGRAVVLHYVQCELVFAPNAAPG